MTERLKTFVLIAAITLSLAQTAFAQQNTPSVKARADIRNAETLAELCRGGETKRIACLAFVTGFVSGAQTSLAELDRTTEKSSTPLKFEDLEYFCLPEGVTSEAIIDKFLALYDTKPDLRREQSRLLLVIALRNNWPCPPN